MRQRFGIDRYGLTVQLVIGFVGLVLLTAFAAGLPAILSIRDQVQRQAWSQVEQGNRATRALYSAWVGNVAHLTALTSQRPTLHSLLAQADQPQLSQFLETLREDTDLDLLVACDGRGRFAVQAGADVAEEIAGELCTLEEGPGFYMLPAGPASRPWLLSVRDIGAGTVSSGTVIAGVAMDDEFIGQMRDRTGLEHTLYVNGQPVASSLPAGVIQAEADTGYPTEALAAGVMQPVRFAVGDRPFYAARAPLDQLAAVQGFMLEHEVALDVGGMIVAEDNLAWMLFGSVLAIALFGSVMAVLLAHRIGRPLAQLSEAAAAFSAGDLHRPVTAARGVREVSQVADALEQARVDLRRTITELQEAQEWNQNLLAAITEGIVILDEDSRISFFSPGAERITGWSREDALGRACNEVFQLFESGELFSQHVPAVGKRNKLVVRLADGRQATLAISGARMAPSAAGESGVALVLRDVTETEIMHRLVGEFLANVTHEFRTPLAALAASAELLLDQAPTLSQAELQELLSALHLSILSLQTLIDNLLESARVEAGRFRVFPQPVDLGQLLEEAVRIMQPLTTKHNQCLLVERPAHIPLVQADPRRVGQVLINLLSNAVKYSPDETEISVRVTTTDRWARVAVADCGPGVPADYHPDLFRPFVRPASTDNLLRHGAGLGLSVTKAIIDAHGGQVEVEDRPGGGSIFWFTLPLAEEDESARG
jgi:two-component system phosphate regulon sensor histidine kinase PhoR